MKIYINGSWVNREEARISVYDHGLLYGDGIFEGMRIYNSRVFKLEQHMERLYRSAAALMLDPGISREKLTEDVLTSVEMSGRKEGYIRLVITRGPGDLGLDPDKCSGATVIIIVDGISLYPREFYTRGIAIVTAATRRLPPDGLDPRIKTLNYLNNIMAKMEAKQAGCIEALMLNQQGYVAECTADNVFIVKDGVLKTPALYNGILEGITRETVLELARENKIPVEETTLSRFDIYTADECFMTGSGAEMVPVITLDGRMIGRGTPGEVTGLLTDSFKKLVNSDS